MPNTEQQKYWFKAKRYGWGWYPASWQGWVVLSVYFLLFGFLIYIYETNIETFLVPYLFSIIGLTGLLILISYKKGEPAGWHWGKK